MEDVLLKVTGLGRTDVKPEIAKAKKLLEAFQSGDPITMVRAMGIELSEGEELSEEMLDKLLPSRSPVNFISATALKLHVPINVFPRTNPEEI